MGATRLRLRVLPGAATPGVVGRHADAWKIRVREVADRGRANDAVLDLVAGTLSVRRGDVRLISGYGASNKIVELAGITAEETDRRLTAAEQKGTR